MKRRHFILYAAAGVGVASVSTYYFMSDVEYDAALAQPRDLPLILDPKKIKDLGDLYRKNHPGESSVRSLVKLLNGTLIDETVNNDFETGNTVLVDGWILSETEARQCALQSTVDSK